MQAGCDTAALARLRFVLPPSAGGVASQLRLPVGGGTSVFGCDTSSVIERTFATIIGVRQHPMEANIE